MVRSFSNYIKLSCPLSKIIALRCIEVAKKRGSVALAPMEGIRAEPVDPSLFIWLSGREKTPPRVQRVHLPFRDASCTLDRSIYRSRALPGARVCLRSLARVLLREIVTPTTVRASVHLERDDISLMRFQVTHLRSW